MKTHLISPGTKTTDAATGLEGMITHIVIDMSHTPKYAFQPYGVEPEHGKPHDSHWSAAARFPDCTTQELDLPLDLLGKTATDDASGITGTVVSLVVHTMGCCHLVLQRPGFDGKGKPFELHDQNMYLCSGEGVPKLTKEEVTEEIKKKPSPAPVSKSTHLG